MPRAAHVAVDVPYNQLNVCLRAPHTRLLTLLAMTEYTSDPAAVAAYYAARDRTNNWLQAVSPNAERPSAPPSLVDDTDDGLSSPSPESDYESDLSLPPRMTLKYPDGRLVSIGPSREERDRVERLRKERERERQFGMTGGGSGKGKQRAYEGSSALYVPPPRAHGGAEAEPITIQPSHSPSSSHSHIPHQPSAYSWRQAPYVPYPPSAYAPAPPSTRSHYPPLPASQPSRPPTSYHPAQASTHHSVVPQSPYQSTHSSAVVSQHGTIVPHAPSQHTQMAGAPVISQTHTVRNSSQPGSRAATFTSQRSHQSHSQSTLIVAPSPVHAFEADKQSALLEPPPGQHHVVPDEPEEIHAHDQGTPVPREATPVLADRTPSAKPRSLHDAPAPQSYHPRQATASGSASQRSARSTSRHKRHVSAPLEGPPPAASSTRSTSRKPPAIIYAASNEDGSYEQFAPPRIIPRSQLSAASRSQPHLGSGSASMHDRSPPRVAPSISDPLPVPPPPAGPSQPAGASIPHGQSSQSHSSGHRSKRTSRSREKADGWERIRASRVPKPEELPPDPPIPASPFAFARLPRLPGRSRAAPVPPPPPPPPPRPHQAPRPPPHHHMQSSQGELGRGRRGRKIPSPSEDDGHESESSGSTYYILPSPGQKVYVVEPPDEFDLAHYQVPPPEWENRPHTLPRRSYQPSTPSSISQAMFGPTIAPAPPHAAAPPPVLSGSAPVLPVPPPHTNAFASMRNRLYAPLGMQRSRSGGAAQVLAPVPPPPIVSHEVQVGIVFRVLRTPPPSRPPFFLS
ncbi:hypothetical protein PENSPDRAFT_682070 [Peniophora sp. CONT]|nr:hypothetical protein PENSPDRAFT_682070 [Peniophora sp. CONT]